MTTRVIVGTVAFVCGVVCAITANIVGFEMVDKVNERLPQERKFPTLWWYLPKLLRLLTEYKKTYPDGGLARKFRVLTVLAFACFIVTAWGIGFFSR